MVLLIWVMIAWSWMKHQITHALDVIRQLNPLNYNQARVKASNNDYEETDYDLTNTKKSSGFIAQDVYEIDEVKHAATQGDNNIGTCL